MRDALEKQGIRCDVLVGGDFFRSPSIRDLRSFLNALVDPWNDAVILQFCEGKWFQAINQSRAPDWCAVEDDAWGPVAGVVDWRKRIVQIATGEKPDDLEPVRQKVRALADSLSRAPTLGWLLRASAFFAPWQMEADSQRVAEHRKLFDHFVSLVDHEFAETWLSARELRDWLNRQHSTNFVEDGPAYEGGSSRVLALTVHKAKGLEFDNVIVPRTWKQFGWIPSGEARLAVVKRDGDDGDDGDDGVNLLWNCPIQNGKKTLGNVSDDDDRWGVDEMEVAKEETRLMYVAMTRAKEQLVVLSSGSPGSGPLPSSWSELLEVGK